MLTRWSVGAMMAVAEFEARILSHLVPEFCEDSSRAWGCEGFVNNCAAVSDVDARDFLAGLGAGVVEHVGRGQYLAPRSCAKEQFFNSGLKTVSPRPFTLAIESVITVATLYRMHNALRWPRVLLGAQSKGWEFDIVAHLPNELEREHIACEVKKTEAELDVLLGSMRHFAQRDDLIPKNRAERNAFKKVQGLRSRRASLFWAVGPSQTSAAFRVRYGSRGAVSLDEVSLQELEYPGVTLVAV